MGSAPSVVDLDSMMGGTGLSEDGIGSAMRQAAAPEHFVPSLPIYVAAPNHASPATPTSPIDTASPGSPRGPERQTMIVTDIPQSPAVYRSQNMKKSRWTGRGAAGRGPGS